MRRIFAIAVTTLLAVTLVGCGGDDGVSTSPTADDTTADTTADDTTDDMTADTTEDSDDDDGDGGGGGGECSVDVSGDKTASWTQPGGIMALNMDYWLSEEMKETFGEDFYFIVNCSGDEGSITFIGGELANEETVPFGPNTYVLNPSDSALGTNETDPIIMMFTLTDSDTNWGVAEPGQLDITAFDDDHIAGTFEFTATDVLYELGGVESEGTVQVTGSFDFDNPN